MLKHQLELRQRDGRRLPREASLKLLAALERGLRPTEVDQLKTSCSADSLERFAWVVFNAWVHAGGPDQGLWVFGGLGALGTDETVHRMTTLVRRWSKEGRVAWCMRGVTVLQRLGSGAALVFLSNLAQNAPSSHLRAEASQALDRAAEALVLSRDELEDMMMPEVDLDGSTRFELGSRTLTLGFDDALQPVLNEATGRRWSRFPGQRKADDPEAYLQARERFRLIKTLLSTTVKTKVVRLEAAMCAGRSWGRPHFYEYFLEHPVMTRVAQRLLWAVLGADGEVRHLFRLDEEGLPVDEDDLPVVIPEGCRVTIPHPLKISSSLPQWRDVFISYEIVQPFQQLDRFTDELPEEVLRGTQFSDCKDRVVLPGRILGLLRRGWTGARLCGKISSLSRRYDDTAVTFSIEPPFSKGEVRTAEPVRMSEVSVLNKFNFLSLSRESRSELLRDLEYLRD